MDAYDLHSKVKNGYASMDIRRGMYDLSQAGILVNKMLKENLAGNRYYEVPHMPGIFKNVFRPTEFTLVVYNFGIKFVTLTMYNISSMHSNNTVK